MNREEIQKLLGGYATGTLTPEEQQALFEASLDDQELFDALAREQALRDLLRDPEAKAQLLAALEQRPPRWYERLVVGWRPLAAAAAMAGVCAIAVVVWQSARPPKAVMVAQLSRPQEDTVTAPAPPAEPAPQTRSVRDTGTPAARDKEAPSVRLAKKTPAKVVIDGLHEEDRRPQARQVAQVQGSKEAADAVTGAPSASNRAVAPPSALPAAPRTVASGFREGGVPGIGGGISGGVLPAPRPMAEPQAPPALRSATGNAAGRGGGVVGGVLGGIIGGVPPGAPTPPAAAPPKAEMQAPQPAPSQAAPPESAASQAKASQSAAAPSAQQQQGQQGQSQSPKFQVQVQAGRSQVEQARLEQPRGAAAQDAMLINGSVSPDLANQDVRSLFYGHSIGSLNAPDTAGGGGSGGSSSARLSPTGLARKKAAGQEEKDQAGGQATTVGALNTLAQAHLLNLGVRYSLMRKSVAGGFEQVDPDSVRAGDTLELQLMPNQRGSLSVRGRTSSGTWREVMSRRVEANKTYTTRPLESAETELQVILTRPPVTLTGVELRDLKLSDSISRQSTTEPATYVVTSPASPQLLFAITLNYK